MTGVVELVRRLPPRWVAVGGGGITLALCVLALAAAGGEDPDRTQSGAVATGPSAPPTSASVASTSVPPPATAARTTPATTTSTQPTIPVIAVDVDQEYRLVFDAETPAVEGRPIPDDPPPEEAPPSTSQAPVWAATTRITGAGHVATDVGCVSDLSASTLDRFFASRVGPVLGWDYQHVYPLGGGRHLWLFQDAFLDHSGTKTTLGTARFIHNAAMLQDGKCFTLLHRGTPDRPLPFEVGDGTVDTRTKWLWPMGGELVGDRLWVFWAEMIKDPYDPEPPDGLGWHPRRVHIASYDASTLARDTYQPARNSSAAPIYGYAVASDAEYTYLFGNTFEQNLVREGGFWNGPHSATKIYLARVPRGLMTEWPEYRTADSWSYAPEDAVPIVDRFYAENPMQPRYLDGQWVASTAVDGYWGDHLAIDVAAQPWGPWTTVQYAPLLPRNADPKMNTYHAHLLPWRDAFGSIQITVSNNARNMLRDAWPFPNRYRPTVFYSPFAPTPAPTTTTTTTTTTTVAPVVTRPPTTTTTEPPSTSTTTTTTTVPSTTSTTTTTTATTTTSTTTVATSTTTVAPGG